MIADANLIAAGLLMLPVAMISRRPSGPQNRGRSPGAVPGISYNVTIDFLAKDTTTNFLQKDTVTGFLQKGV